jgi:hypothetical protein
MVGGDEDDAAWHGRPDGVGDRARVHGDVGLLRTGKGVHAGAAGFGVAAVARRGCYPDPRLHARAERVAENASAVDLAPTPEDLASLDDIGARVAGARYPEGGMKAVNR